MANLKLVGSRIVKINAERNHDFSGKLEMSTNIQIKEIELIKDSKETIKVTYLFEIDYKELGKVSVEGNIFLTGETKIIKELLKNQKDKKYETPTHIAITNLIIQKASVKAIELEEELMLPIHIKLPTLSIKKDN
jgi:hypothetical protein